MRLRAHRTFHHPSAWFFVILFVAFGSVSNAFQWPSSSADPPPSAGSSSESSKEHQLGGSIPAVFESEAEGLFASHRSVIQEAQQMMTQKDGSLEGSCWQNSYKKLLSNCREILRDEEKKARLAYRLTECFLKMTGWAAPMNCPGNVLVRTCTEKFDNHTHTVYLAFFVDMASMCHHLQSEAFKLETDYAINELKGSAHWMVEKLDDIHVQSDEILNHAFEQSRKLQLKLEEIGTRSQSILELNDKMQDRLKSIQDTSQAIYERGDQIKNLQNAAHEEHAAMNKALHEGTARLKEAAEETQRQLQGVADEQKQLAEGQQKLAEALVAQLDRLKEKALESLTQLQESQFAAMEVTRLSGFVDHPSLDLQRKLERSSRTSKIGSQRCMKHTNALRVDLSKCLLHKYEIAYCLNRVLAIIPWN